MITPSWFKVNDQHSLRDGRGAAATHLFFDLSPELIAENKMANVIITTPEGSPHHYALDLASGQRHYTHSYCKQKDIWARQSGVFDRPPYSIGHIPRLLDQLGYPQKVLVFGNSKKISETVDFNYYRVRIIGAYVEQICPEGNCLGKSNWLSHLVYIAIDPDEAKLVNVKDLKSFSEHFDWQDVKSYLENVDGRNFVGSQTYPFLRVGNLIPFADAFEFSKRHSIMMSQAESKKIQSGCHALYDRLWKEVGEERPEDLAATTPEAMKEKVKLIAELKKKKAIVGFSRRFQAFTKKYFDEMNVCGKFVYHGNINQDPEKFWFLSYVDIYYRLHKEGYFYDCNSKTWKENTLDHEGKPVYDLKRDVGQCDEKDIDTGMGYLPNFLVNLKNSSSVGFYRFIDYDTHSFGTHHKLYSWVKFPGKKFECSKDFNETVMKNIKIFPEDVNWKNRSVKDKESELRIIY